jgi:hypothetical protein
MHAWRFGLPQDPKAWIIRAAHNRAIDIIRREQRHRSFLPELATTTLADTIEAALAPGAESVSQLAMMLAVCDPGLNRETHVTLILRYSLEQLDNYDAFVMGPGHLREVLRELGSDRWQPLHRPHQRHAQVRRIPIPDPDAMECHPPRA